MAADPKNPWWYIPTLYFAEGLPYTMVNLASVPMFKGLQIDNSLIGLTSLLYLPWTLKFLWSPFIEQTATKRRWVLATQFVLAALFGLCGLGMLGPAPALCAVVVFIPIAFVSASHDIATDGYYLDRLDTRQQALFVGIRTTAYKFAWLAGTGALVFAAGWFGNRLGLLAHGWAISMFIVTLSFIFLTAFHRAVMPTEVSGPRKTHRVILREFAQSFGSYFRQPRIVPIIAFVLFFRLGDALMLKMAQPFLMDPATAGGLGLDTETIGLVYGTVGTICSVLGGITGGLLVARGGLRTWMWPFALIQNVFILLYWMLSLMRPGVAWVTLVNAFEQFAYGLGVSGYTVFLMRTVVPAYRTSHYAITTSFMALGMMLPQAASGFMQKALGYPSFFLLSFFLALPGMLLLFAIPYRERPDRAETDRAES